MFDLSRTSDFVFATNGCPLSACFLPSFPPSFPMPPTHPELVSHSKSDDSRRREPISDTPSIGKTPQFSSDSNNKANVDHTSGVIKRYLAVTFSIPLLKP